MLLNLGSWFQDFVVLTILEHGTGLTAKVFLSAGSSYYHARSFLVGKENSNDIPGFLCFSSIVSALERQKFDCYAVKEHATCTHKMQVWPQTACDVYSTCCYCVIDGISTH